MQWRNMGMWRPRQNHFVAPLITKISQPGGVFWHLQNDDARGNCPPLSSLCYASAAMCLNYEMVCLFGNQKRKIKEN